MGRPAGDPLILTAAVLLLMILPLATAQPWWSCDRSAGSYSEGGAFETSLLSLISALSANASASPTRFASGSSSSSSSTVSGAAEDTVVYGLLLCRADLMPQRCSRCGARAAADLGRACKGTRPRDAALLYDECYLRVSGLDFLSSLANTGKVNVTSPNPFPAGVDGGAFVAAVLRLLNATAQHAVDRSAPSPPPRTYSATGQLVGFDPRVPGIWSAAQCAGDLSPQQCRNCLDDQWRTQYLNLG